MFGSSFKSSNLTLRWTTCPAHGARQTPTFKPLHQTAIVVQMVAGGQHVMPFVSSSLLPPFSVVLSADGTPLVLLAHVGGVHRHHANRTRGRFVTLFNVGDHFFGHISSIIKDLRQETRRHPPPGVLSIHCGSQQHQLTTAPQTQDTSVHEIITQCQRGHSTQGKQRQQGQGAKRPPYVQGQTQPSAQCNNVIFLVHFHDVVRRVKPSIGQQLWQGKGQQDQQHAFDQGKSMVQQRHHE